MRFRMGLVIGFGTGYVLGTMAGRERYEQIRAAATGLWESGAGQQLRSAAAGTAGRVQQQAGVKLRSIREQAIDLTETAPARL